MFKLLTRCFVEMNFSFDELLELSQKGDNRAIDMLVGDIYGGLDYSKVNFTVDLIIIYYKCSSYSVRKVQINFKE